MEAPPVPRPTSPKPYVNAPACPRRHIISSFPEYFYTVPTSHTKSLSVFVASCQSKLKSPIATTTSFETDSCNDDGFAFSTGQSFRSSPPYLHEPQQWQRTIDGPPAMAFADELFHNGLLLPLKLPPRLQHISSLSSPTSPVTSPSLIPRRGFPVLSFGKKKFDHFMEAIEQIRREGADKRGHRRARSFEATRTRWVDGPAERALHCEQEKEQPTGNGCKKSKSTKISCFKDA